MKSFKKVFTVGFIFILSLSPYNAFANGGDFFNELSSAWGANEDTGTPFFGFVRDENGKAVKNALISASLGDTSIVIIADAQGHYKIPGMGKEVDAKEVQINCAKAGYTLKQLDRRQLRSIPKAPIEVNCKMQKV